MKTVRVKVDRTGTLVRTEAEGFTGEGCRAATGPYLEKFGVSPHEELKPEFNEQQLDEHIDGN